MKRHLRNFLLPLIIPIIFLCFWDVMAGRIQNDILLPEVGQVAALIADPSQDLVALGTLPMNTLISLARVFTGYLVAVLLGIPLGIFMGYIHGAEKLFSSFLGFFRAIPPLAWVPLVLAWFGISSLASLFNIPIGPLYPYFHNIKLSMVFIIFIGGFYPILTSTIHGVEMVPLTYLDAAKVMGANRRDIFCKVLLPCALPSIVNGMRIGLGVAWMCLVSAEMLPGSLSGVGYLITHAYDVGRTDVVVTGMISIGATGAVMDVFFRIFENRKFAWKRLTRQ